MKKIQDHQREDNEWKGYTIDELRYQRAYALARLELEKEKIAAGFHHLYKSTPGTMGTGILRKMMGGLTYIDYAVLAYKLGHRIYKMFR